MPIRIQNNLPATEILEKENIFVMPEDRAFRQDIRPLKILILNLMPNKIATETQLLRVLSNSPLQVPLWIPQGLWVAGLGLFAAVAVALATQASWMLFRNPSRLNALYGPPTIEEEIEESLEATQAGGVRS